jgi:hypothetical protein
MSKWLDISQNVNHIQKSYFNGFIDISGGGLTIRNGNSINLYGNTNLTNSPDVVISSSTISVSNTSFPTSYLAYLGNLTSDVQNQINDVNIDLGETNTRVASVENKTQKQT